MEDFEMKRISFSSAYRLAITVSCLAVFIGSQIPALAEVNIPAIQEIAGSTAGSSNLSLGYVFSTDVAIRVTHLGKYIEWGADANASSWEAKIWDSAGISVLATVNIQATTPPEDVNGNTLIFEPLSSPVDLPAGTYVVAVASCGASGDKHKVSCTTLTTGAHVMLVKEGSKYGRYKSWTGGTIPYPSQLGPATPSYFGPNFKYVVAVPLIEANTPADAYVASGGDAVFTIAAINPVTGDANGLQYQWRKGDANLSEGAKYVDTNTPSLTVQDVNASDEVSYYCRVTITSTSFMADSRAAKLVMKRLLGHWPLDGNAVDTSGNGNNGTLMNNPSFVAGKVDGNALSLNGTNQYVAIPTGSIVPAIADSNAVSISVWENGGPTSASAQAMVGATNGTNIMLQAMIIIPYMDSYVYWDTGPADVNTDQVYQIVEPNEYSGGWNHWVFTKNRSIGLMAIYHNGQLWGFGTVRTKPMSGATSLSLGASAGGTIKFFQGLIDDVQIYNYPLDATEVAYLYALANGDICVEPPEYDLDDDCYVNFADLALFAEKWSDCGLFPTCIQTVP
jgi:hypothetical protein